MEKLAQSQRQTPPPRLGRRRLGGKKDYALLLFLLPGIVFLIFFRYAPMCGRVYSATKKALISLHFQAKYAIITARE